MLDRKVAPGYLRNTSFDLIQPQKKRLPNGIDLFMVRGGSQEVLRIELLFKAGRWFEKKWGTSYFSSHLLTKGTRKKNSFEIAQVFDQFGAHLEVSSGLDHISVSLYSLTKNLAPVLELLSEIVQEPVFPQKEIGQAKSIYIQNLKVNNEKTSFLASKHFRKSVFGQEHPYGKELEEEDIARLQQEDLSDHFNTFFGEVAVFVSGKIEPAGEAQIVDVLSDWKTGKAGPVTHPAPALQPFRKHIEKKDSVQSSVRMGRSSILRSHPDYAHVMFISHILGGYFGSRLMKNIREEKGLTYGIYASLHPMKYGSYLVIGADVNKENVRLTFEEIRKEMKRLCDTPISSDELETARNHFIGSLQSELTTPFAHADKLRSIYLYGLSSDYYQQMITTIENISPEVILRNSALYFNEEDFFEIAVG
jgi:predicted Zn-dependent peptidase